MLNICYHEKKEIMLLCLFVKISTLWPHKGPLVITIASVIEIEEKI